MFVVPRAVRFVLLEREQRFVLVITYRNQQSRWRTGDARVYCMSSTGLVDCAQAGRMADPNNGAHDSSTSQINRNCYKGSSAANVGFKQSGT